MTTDPARMSTEELLRAAIDEERRIGGQHSGFLLGQLYSGAVSGDPRLEAIWEEETAPEQLEVDLHLGGPGTEDHSTSVRHLSRFVSGINDATKQLTSDRTGQRWSHDLLMQGVAPGSVRVVLRVEDLAPARQGALAVVGDRRPYQSTPQSESLRLIARLLTDASGPQPAIAGDVRSLPLRARKSLKRSIQAARTAGWEIAGRVRQRSWGASELSVTPKGLTVLSLELDNHDFESRREWIEGTIDGFRRSLGSFYFTPAGGQRAFAVSADASVLAKAAPLGVDPDTRVRAFIETVWTAEDADAKVSASRQLLDIEEAQFGKQLEMPNPPLYTDRSPRRNGLERGEE